MHSIKVLNFELLQIIRIDFGSSCSWCFYLNAVLYYNYKDSTLKLSGVAGMCRQMKGKDHLLSQK